MHDHLVGRGADRPGEAAVALEGGHAAAGADVLLGQRVQLCGGDALAGAGLHQLQRRGDHPAGPRHDLDLGCGLANDHEPSPSRASRASSSAETCSRVPPASMKHDQAGRIVVVEHRLGRLHPLLLVAGADHRLGVVVALVELGAVDVADAGRLRRCADEVVDVLGLAADATAAHPLQQLLEAQVEDRHRRDAAVKLCQRGVQRLGLGERAREAVQDEPALGVRRRQALAEHADDHVVGHEVAAGHDLLGHQPQLGAVSHRLAQHVAGGDVGEPVQRRHARSLGALAGPGRAHEDQVERHLRPTSGSPCSCASKAATRSDAWYRWQRRPRSARRFRPAHARWPC